MRTFLGVAAALFVTRWRAARPPTGTRLVLPLVPNVGVVPLAGGEAADHAGRGVVVNRRTDGYASVPVH